MIAGTVLFEMMLRGLAVGALASIVIGWRRAGASRDAQLAGLLFLACVTAFASCGAAFVRAFETLRASAS